MNKSSTESERSAVPGQYEQWGVNTDEFLLKLTHIPTWPNAATSVKYNKLGWISTLVLNIIQRRRIPESWPGPLYDRL